MRSTKRRQESGFTILETAAVVLIVGVVVAVATPKISNAMREYRLNIATRQLADIVNRAKTQAVSDNRKSSLVVDTANKKMGIIVYDVAGNVVRTDFMPLPQGISFTMPAGVSAPVTGAPTSRACTFAAQGGSSTVFQQDFNSRGFPVVAAGAINALYLSNGMTYRAITVNSVCGLRTFRWEDGGWVDSRH